MWSGGEGRGRQPGAQSPVLNAEPVHLPDLRWLNIQMRGYLTACKTPSTGRVLRPRPEIASRRDVATPASARDRSACKTVGTAGALPPCRDHAQRLPPPDSPSAADPSGQGDFSPHSKPLCAGECRRLLRAPSKPTAPALTINARVPAFLPSPQYRYLRPLAEVQPPSRRARERRVRRPPCEPLGSANNQTSAFRHQIFPSLQEARRRDI